MPPLIGLVLAGGQGARFGKPKGEVLFHGRTLAQCSAEVLWPLCTGVLVSIRAGGRNPDLLVLACDYPLIDTALLAHLTRAGTEGDMVMLTDNKGRDHPLAAVWRRSCLDRLSAALADKRYKVRGLLGELDVIRIGPGEVPDRDLSRALTNVNTEDQLRRMS